jgi:hypothetical protein
MTVFVTLSSNILIYPLLGEIHVVFALWATGLLLRLSTILPDVVAMLAV